MRHSGYSIGSSTGSGGWACSLLSIVRLRSRGTDRGVASWVRRVFVQCFALLTDGDVVPALADHKSPFTMAARFLARSGIVYIGSLQ